MVFGWGKKKHRVDDARQAATRTVKIREIPDIIASAKDAESTRLVKQHEELYVHVREHVKMLLQIATELEKEDVNTDDIDVNIATIVKRGKKQVLHIIHKESQRRLPRISSADDVKEFNKSAAHILAKIGDALGKQTRVIHIFAKRHANRIKDILRVFTEDMEHSRRLLQRYTEFEDRHDEIARLLGALDADSQASEDSLKKVAEMEADSDRLRAEMDDAGKKISEFEASQTYKSYLGLQDELKAHDGTRAGIERRINDCTILISRPISKYSYGSSLDKEYMALAEKIQYSPMDVFVGPNREGITAILDGMRKAITLGHMSVKEPQKTIGYIDDVASRLDEFIRMVESFQARRETLQGEIGRHDVSCLDTYRTHVSKARTEQEFLRSRIAELKKESDAREQSRPSMINDMQRLLNQISDARCVIDAS